MHPNKLIQKITLITCVLMGILICISIWFLPVLIVLKTIVFGTIVSLFGLQLIAFSLTNLQKTKWRSYLDYVLRMLVYASAIYIAFLLELNLPLFVVSLLLSKIAIVIYGLYYRGGKDGHK